jgi:hypothetical protein
MTNISSPIYRLYFDDIEEIFFNSISMKSLLLCSLLTILLTMTCLIILLYRSNTIFLACFIPCVYSLIAYDCLQLLSIVLLKYHLNHADQASVEGHLCRWSYYLKATAEAGQCLTLVLIYITRRHKLRYFMKHQHLPNSSRIHTRALTFVSCLCIVYVNNWITHLKVEKIHLITTMSIDIEESPIALYDSMRNGHYIDRRQFSLDLERYATIVYDRHEQSPSMRIRSIKPAEKIIHNSRDEFIHEIIIKIPYRHIFQSSNPIVSTNRTRRKQNRRYRRWQTKNQSYGVHRCTYAQRHFNVVNLITMIHGCFYLIVISYFLATIRRETIPSMAMIYHRKLHDRALAMGRKKSADRHQQLILLMHLKHFQYLFVYCHTILILIRLVYVCSLTAIVWCVPSPFRWSTIRTIFYTLFFIVYYSIPLRLLLVFIYLVLSLCSSSIHSIFYSIFYTKLHFSCQLHKPSIRFHLHFTPFDEQNIHADEHSNNSLTDDEHGNGTTNDFTSVNDDLSANQQSTSRTSYMPHSTSIRIE